MLIGLLHGFIRRPAAALHCIFVRRVQGEHDRGVRVTQRVEPVEGDTGFFCGGGKSVSDGLRAGHDDAWAVVRRIGQDLYDIVREREPATGLFGLSRRS